MKNMLGQIKRSTLITGIIMLFVITHSFAQDTVAYSTTTTTTTQDQWYMQPWAWVAGGVAILLILIALFSGNKKSKSRTDRVIITKTVRSETDID